MKLTFKGKSAIVTGASGGMGIECVKKLNEARLKVLMLDLKDPPVSLLKKYNKLPMVSSVNSLIFFLFIVTARLASFKRAPLQSGQF